MAITIESSARPCPQKSPKSSLSQNDNKMFNTQKNINNYLGPGKKNLEPYVIRGYPQTLSYQSYILFNSLSQAISISQIENLTRKRKSNLLNNWALITILSEEKLMNNVRIKGATG